MTLFGHALDWAQLTGIALWAIGITALIASGVKLRGRG